ncbi:MAG TPA: FtsX-like permease family protein [Vicinamibacterales bacterium]
MKYFPLIWRNLLRRKVRTIFTIGSIFVAFLLFGILMAVRSAFSMGVDFAGADRMMVLNKISLIMPLPASYEERLKAIDGVSMVTHANWFGGYYQETRNQFPNMAVEADNWLDMYPEFVLPEDQKKAWQADRSGAIVGADTARKYGWKVGDRVPLQATIFRRPGHEAWEFNISGIYDSPVKGADKTQLFFHYDYLNEVVRNTGFADQVGWYVIKISDPERAAAVAKKVDELFANSPAETKTDTEKAFIQGFAKQIGNISLITQLVATAAILMILLITANTMAQSIRERTNELAVLKTLGFRDGRVLAMVLAESVLIAVVGGALGLLAAWTFVAGVGDPTGGFLPTFFFPVRDLVVGAGLVLLLGVFAGSLPALQASRLRIVEALRRN